MLFNIQITMPNGKQRNYRIHRDTPRLHMMAQSAEKLLKAFSRAYPNARIKITTESEFLH